jgi:pyruvate dehydrogenase E2 component (dihydrolipoamide acetyltransferase)
MIEITVPRLGWSMEEGAFSEWLKGDGEWVEKGDMLFVLESDKAAQEIESFDAGVLRLGPDSPKPGDTVRVGQVIGRLLARDESDVAQATAATPLNLRETTLAAVAPSALTSAREVEGTTADTSPSEPLTIANQVPVASDAQRVATPRARRAARERGVDWSTVKGTGRNGRIRERDVLAAPVGGPSAAKAEAVADTFLAISATRRAIADRMIASLRSTAPVTLTTKVNAANLVNLRRQLKAAAGQESDGNGLPDESGAIAVPGITDIIIKLAAVALRRHPEINSRWQDDQIFRSGAIQIGLAVDTETGLLVPVINNVDKLSLKQVAARSAVLVEKARGRRLSADELRGGTFTVSNLGTFGVDAFTPIINPPETAILGVGSIRREAIVLDDDRIVPGEVMTLSLTFDHRTVDGAPAARFLQTLRSLVENPAGWLVE